MIHAFSIGLALGIGISSAFWGYLYHQDTKKTQAWIERLKRLEHIIYGE